MGGFLYLWQNQKVMKKILSVLLLAVAFFANAQVEQFKKLDSLQFENTKAEIIKLTGRNYVKDHEEIGIFKGKITNEYYNAEKKSEAFTIYGYEFMDGANPALEIKGTPKYAINSIRGAFLAVYPFWLKYIDPNADRDKIIKDERGWTPKDRFIRMYKLSNGDNDWMLEF